MKNRLFQPIPMTWLLAEEGPCLSNTEEMNPETKSR